MRTIAVSALALAALVAGCGGGGAPSSGRAAHGAGTPAQHGAAAAGHADWTRFDYDAARSGHAPTGLPARAVRGLTERRIALPGTVDASPIYLGAIRAGGKRRGLLVMTTTYGITVGLDAATGRQVWRFTPASYDRVAGSAQITTATPVADRAHGLVYAASPDGRIHALRLRDGHERRRGGWPASVTRDATHEKIASALNLDGRWVLVTTGGYIGDAPPYQGKVVAIHRSTGRVAHVVNSLCSDRRRIIVPRTCRSSDSAIWGRAGAVVDPRTHHVFATSSNGPFDGRTDWGDSILELAPGAGRLLRHYTPSDQAELSRGDVDLGSTSPVLLRDGAGRTRFLLQGGKDAKLRVVAVAGGLSGVTGRAGRRLGGERHSVGAPGGALVFTAPAVRRARGQTQVFVATGGGTAAYALRGGRLHERWHNATAGTSPVLAGGVLWVYDPRGALNAYRPADGHRIRTLPAPPGHWNSPIVAGGRVYLPSGDANQHATSGTLSIYAP